jgi:hypothetical protein
LELDGDRVFLGGETMHVWWNSCDVYTANTVSIYLSNDDGVNYESVKTCSNEGVATFVMPSTSCVSSKVKIVAGPEDSQIESNSSSFVIEVPEISILYPTHGSVFKLPVGRSNVDTQDLGWARAWWNTNIYNDRHLELYVSTNSGVDWAPMSSLDQSVTGDNTGYVYFGGAVSMATDMCVLKAEYTNQYGDTISATTSGIFTIVYPDERLSWGYSTTAPTIEYSGGIEGEWSSMCTCNGKIYIVKESDYKIYEYDPVATTITEFLTFEKIGFLNRPFIAATMGNFYLVDSVDFAFYEYDSNESDWRSLTQMGARPYCFTALHDDSS